MMTSASARPLAVARRDGRALSFDGEVAFDGAAMRAAKLKARLEAVIKAAETIAAPISTETASGAPDSLGNASSSPAGSITSAAWVRTAESFPAAEAATGKTVLR
jgi:hypothetical protein